jgi:hypothetical protein
MVRHGNLLLRPIPEPKKVLGALLVSKLDRLSRKVSFIATLMDDKRTPTCAILRRH